METLLEPAPTGRAKCRGCGRAIAKDELRLGELATNPFSDNTPMTLWFHLVCGAFKRPEALLAAFETHSPPIDHAERDRLRSEAERGIEHRRLPRVDGAQRAPSGRAKCRGCKETIAKGTWRIPLVYYDDGRFEPSGFLHVACARSYFGTSDVLERLRHFQSDLSDDDVGELRGALGSGSGEAGTE